MKNIMTIDPAKLRMRTGEIHGGEKDGQSCIGFIIPVYEEGYINWNMTREVAIAVKEAVDMFLEETK